MAAIISPEHKRRRAKKMQEHQEEPKEKRIKEDNEDYFPATDSSDSEDECVIYSGGCREDLLINSDTPGSKLTFSRKQRLLFEEQMRMCVQLTTQAFLLSADVHQSNSAKGYLMEMASLASDQTAIGKMSFFESVNLADALAIVERFDRIKSRNAETFFKMKQVLCESRVFMYPDLCPQRFFQSSRVILTRLQMSKSHLIFDDSEDNLIALGLETFRSRFVKFKDHYLPCRTRREIMERINSALSSKKKSVIKYFKKHEEMPEFEMKIRPFDENTIKAPIEHDVKDLPKWMVPYVTAFVRGDPSPQFLETESDVAEDNYEVTDKPVCKVPDSKPYNFEKGSKSFNSKKSFPHYDSQKDLKLYNSRRRYVSCRSYGISNEIDLCQEFCDPTLVNSNFNEFANDIDLDISMSGGIKLSALKKTKPHSNSHSVNNQCGESDSLIPKSSNVPKLKKDIKSEDLDQESEDFSSISTSTDLKLDFSFGQVSSGIYMKNVDVPCINLEMSQLPSDVNNEEPYFKNVSIKVENENDTISLQNESGSMKSGQYNLHFAASTCNNQIFSAIKIKEEPH